MLKVSLLPSPPLEVRRARRNNRAPAAAAAAAAREAGAASCARLSCTAETLDKATGQQFRCSVGRSAGSSHRYRARLTGRAMGMTWHQRHHGWLPRSWRAPWMPGGRSRSTKPTARRWPKMPDCRAASSSPRPSSPSRRWSTRTRRRRLSCRCRVPRCSCATPWCSWARPWPSGSGSASRRLASCQRRRTEAAYRRYGTSGCRACRRRRGRPTRPSWRCGPCWSRRCSPAGPTSWAT